MKLSALTPVILCLTLALSACGGGSSSSTPAPTPPPPPPPPARDTTAPVITLNGDNTLTVSAGSTFTDLGATATDDTDGEVAVSVTGEVTVDVVKSYTITYSATDAAGNQSTLTRTVNVIDDTAPVISLTGGNEVSHSAGTEYVDAGASATDNIDGDIEVTVTGSVDTSTPDSYTLTYSATDAAGNETSLTRTISVVDDLAPEIVLNGVSPLAHKAGDVYNDLGVVVTDNFDELSDITLVTSAAVEVTEVANYTVTYTATDRAGNTSSLTRVVNVVDLTPPDIDLNGALEISLSDGALYVEESATATDNIDEEVTVTISGDVLINAGTYIITYTATDEAGNTATATRTVIVEEDSVPESFTLTEKTEVFLAAGIESEAFTVTGINTPIAVSIVDGEYSIDDEPYTADAGTITVGQTIKVKVISASTLATESHTTLTLSNLSETFTVTTRSAEPSGIFTGTGTVNTDVANVSLNDVKGMVYQERFIFFNEAENLLYDGTITEYNLSNFNASVDVYKDGVINSTVSATGIITNQASIALTMTGTGYGAGTIDMGYFRDNGGSGDPYYDRGASEARYSTAEVNSWFADNGSNTTMQGLDFYIDGKAEADVFYAVTNTLYSCRYDGTKTIPDSENNLFGMSFNINHSLADESCDQVGTGFTGMMTLVDGGSIERFIDGTLWFAATNGEYATFSTPVYYDVP